MLKFVLCLPLLPLLLQEAWPLLPWLSSQEHHLPIALVVCVGLVFDDVFVFFFVVHLSKTNKQTKKRCWPFMCSLSCLPCWLHCYGLWVVFFLFAWCSRRNWSPQVSELSVRGLRKISTAATECKEQRHTQVEFHPKPKKIETKRRENTEKCTLRMLHELWTDWKSTGSRRRERNEEHRRIE